MVDIQVPMPRPDYVEMPPAHLGPYVCPRCHGRGMIAGKAELEICPACKGKCVLWRPDIVL